VTAPDGERGRLCRVFKRGTRLLARGPRRPLIRQSIQI
jgi:hypothetical protein